MKPLPFLKAGTECLLLGHTPLVLSQSSRACGEPHRCVPGLVIAFLPKTGGKTGTGSRLAGRIRNLGSLHPTLLT